MSVRETEKRRERKKETGRGKGGREGGRASERKRERCFAVLSALRYVVSCWPILCICIESITKTAHQAICGGSRSTTMYPLIDVRDDL